MTGEHKTLTAVFFRTARILRGIGGPEYAQQKVLRILLEQEEVSQKELLERLQVKAGSLSELITKLEKKGYVVREKSRNDRRRTILRITEEGRRKAAEFDETRDDRLFSVLNTEEREQMKEYLERVLDHWEEEQS